MHNALTFCRMFPTQNRPPFALPALLHPPPNWPMLAHSTHSMKHREFVAIVAGIRMEPRPMCRCAVWALLHFWFSCSATHTRTHTHTHTHGPTPTHTCIMQGLSGSGSGSGSGCATWNIRVIAAIKTCVYSALLIAFRLLGVKSRNRNRNISDTFSVALSLWRFPSLPFHAMSIFLQKGCG